jgi:salicylate hydroxylase
MVEAFGFPHYQTHRADLLASLVEALPADRLHVGHRFERLEDRGDRVEAHFANGATEVTAQIWMGPAAHFVHYFVQRKRLVNFVAVVEQDSWTGESWTDRGEVADALAAFAGWHPQVREIIGAVDETFIWALFDRPPLPRWTKGRATLLGDACHPMLPFMAQGAAQGLEDGATLTACLLHDADVPRALQRYERLRLPRATRIQAMSTENKHRFHLPDGPEQEERDARMASGSTDFAVKAVGWIYAHDARAA